MSKAGPGPSSKGLQPLCLSGLQVPHSLLQNNQCACLLLGCIPLGSPAKDFCEGEGGQVSGLQEGSLPGVSPPEVAGGFIYQAPGIVLLGLSWQETGVEGKGSERSSTPPATAAAP